MGPSGSGKTTLLDVLAGRKTVGELQGDILYANQTASSNFLRRHTGYVEQFDTLLDNLTVYEMLLYTAEMKNPVSDSFETKRSKVETVIKELGLDSCKDVVVGSQLHRGISGGQAKRANIGLALVTQPHVLFLDEPTSGLDSYTANEVMSVVKQLTVDSGITVVSTIHSPTPFAFKLFDQVMLLLCGRVVYFGKNGESAQLYFEALRPEANEFGSKGAPDNLAEWIVDLTTSANRNGEALEFAASYEESQQNEEVVKQLEYFTRQSHEVSQRTLDALNVNRATSTPFWWGLWTMLRYRTPKNFKDPAYILPRVMDKLLVSFIIATLYLHKGAVITPEDVSNVTALLFMWTILPGFTATSYIPSIVLERPLFIRERNDGLYRPITYLTAKMLEELFIALINSAVFSCLVYFPTGLRGSFIIYWLVYFVTTSIGIVLAYFIGAISPNMDVANTAFPAYIMTLLFFVGMLIRAQDQPKWWHWYSYLNFLKYGWSAQMVNYFEGTDIPIFGGVEVLEFYALTGMDKWAQLGFQSLFFVAFFVLAWVALAFVKHQKR